MSEAIVLAAVALVLAAGAAVAVHLLRQRLRGLQRGVLAPQMRGDPPAKPGKEELDCYYQQLLAASDLLVEHGTSLGELSSEQLHVLLAGLGIPETAWPRLVEEYGVVPITNDCYTFPMPPLPLPVIPVPLQTQQPQQREPPVAPPPAPPIAGAYGNLADIRKLELFSIEDAAVPDNPERTHMGVTEIAEIRERIFRSQDADRLWSVFYMWTRDHGVFDPMAAVWFAMTPEAQRIMAAQGALAALTFVWGRENIVTPGEAYTNSPVVRDLAFLLARSYHPSKDDAFEASAADLITSVITHEKLELALPGWVFPEEWYAANRCYLGGFMVGLMACVRYPDLTKKARKARLADMIAKHRPS